MYAAWSNIFHSDAFAVAITIIHAGFIHWANVRDLERAPERHRRPRRRVPRHARQLFIWGFIGINVAVWAAVPKSSMLRNPFKPPPPRELGDTLRSLRYMVDNFALTTRNLSEGRYWTLLGYGMSHSELGHLLGNMCEFYVWASRCFDLGMGVEGVVGLMVGSGVCSGLACIFGKDASCPVACLGASGIVCGLQTAATLLERVPNEDVIRNYIFSHLLARRAVDLIGLLIQRLELDLRWLTGEDSLSISFAGHLGGTTFGVFYWCIWLRSRFGTW